MLAPVLNIIMRKCSKTFEKVNATASANTQKALLETEDREERKDKLQLTNINFHSYKAHHLY